MLGAGSAVIAAVLSAGAFSSTAAVAEVPAPVLSPTQVLIRTRYAVVDRYDLAAGGARSGVGGRTPLVLGSQLSGEVVAVGAARADLTVGTAVFGWADSGAQAEFAAATAVAAVPDGVDLAAAATLPDAVAEAVWAMTELQLSTGETLLVLGPSTPIGAVALQLAVAAGARVVGADSLAAAATVEVGTAAPSGPGGVLALVRALPGRGIDAVLVVDDEDGHRGVRLVGSRDRVVSVSGGRRPRRAAPGWAVGAAGSLEQIRAVQAVVGMIRLQTADPTVFSLRDVAAAHAFRRTATSGAVVVQAG